MKTCTVCQESKPLSEYYNSSTYKDGKAYRCKTCDNLAVAKYRELHRERRLDSQRKASRKFKYNLSEDEYQQMLKDQQNKCAICAVELKQYGTVRHKNDTLCIDHDHETGKVRGILCHQCNLGLGKFKESVEIIKNAVRYLNG